MRAELVAAYILHTRAYRETSIQLEALTEAYGRIGLVYQVGRTVRATRLPSFTPVRLTWQGKGELYRLTKVEHVAKPDLQAPLHQICGLYINELMLRLIPRNNPIERLYALYESTMKSLGTTDNVERVLRPFEIQLLDVIGYGLQLECEVGTGQGLDHYRWYRYAVESGPLETSEVNANEWDVVQGRTLMALSAGTVLDNDMLRQAKQLLKGVLDFHLQGRPIMTRKIFKYLNS